MKAKKYKAENIEISDSPEKFSVNANAGEKYYQIHVFDYMNGLKRMIVKSKIDKAGNIICQILRIEGNFMDAQMTNKINKEDFERLMKGMLEAAAMRNAEHKKIDLTKYKKVVDQVKALLDSGLGLKAEFKDSDKK